MSYLAKQIHLFSILPFRWFIISCTLATLGNGLAYVAMTWLVLEMHDNISSVAILMMCFWLPSVLLGPLCGVLVDRYNRKWLMLIANACRAFLLLSFALPFIHHFSSIAMYIRGICIGTFSALYGPAAMAFVRELVNKRDLMLANSATDVAYEVGSIFGMGTAGLLLAVVSPYMAIIINGCCFVLATLVVACIKYKPLSKMPVQKSFITDYILGIRYLISSRALLFIYITQLLLMVNFMIAPILLAPFAKNILHLNVAGFGQLEALMSVGIVLGGLLSPYLVEKIGARIVLLTEVAVLTICFMLFSQVKLFYLAAILYFIIGLCLSVWPLIITKAQEFTDFNYQGRVQATFNAFAGLIILGVYWVIYLGGNDVPIRHMYWFSALFGAIATFLLWRLRKHL